MRTQIVTAFAIAAFLLTGCEIKEKSDAEKLIAEWRGHTVAFIQWPENRITGHGYYFENSNKVLIKEPEGDCYFGRYTIEGSVITYSYPNRGTKSLLIIGKRSHSANNPAYATINDVNTERYATGKIISDQKLACEPGNIN